MRDAAERILTTHVGSLVRPPALLDYITAIEKGVQVDQAAFDACLQSSIDTVVRQQVEAGVDVVSDGEFGKFRSWSFYIMDRLAGFEERSPVNFDGTPSPAALSSRYGTDAKRFPEFYSEYFGTQGFTYRGVPTCVGPIKYRGQQALKKDIDHFKAALAGVTTAGAFLPVVAPASAMPRYRDEHYGDDVKFFYALADAMREEYVAIVEAGLHVQIDDAFLPYVWDITFESKNLPQYRDWAQLRIDVLNHAIRGLPREKIRYHICWGSFNTPHIGDIPFKDIADLVLQVNAGAYCIEMANPRHEHEWRVWERVKLPPDAKLIPGVVSHCTNVVEHPELIAERLVRLAKLVGRENVLAGTDCGFAQGPHVRRVHPSIMWAKLQSQAEGARLASKELWG
jgi:5-methyltetrahydropteroyltriglutamate--homocysteine methyltransferase